MYYTYLDKTYFLELTDEQINWSCAEALGWKPVYEGPAKPFWGPVEIPMEKWDPLRNYAQCGLILDWLEKKYFVVCVDYFRKNFYKDIWINKYRAYVYKNEIKYEFSATNRNRAVCLLFLKSAQEDWVGS